MTGADPNRTFCLFAVHTRKSNEKELEMEFNSLDAAVSDPDRVG
jgi:hypothetical protein